MVFEEHVYWCNYFVNPLHCSRISHFVQVSESLLSKLFVTYRESNKIEEKHVFCIYQYEEMFTDFAPRLLIRLDVSCHQRFLNFSFQSTEN